jgi:hypothetical protein
MTKERRKFFRDVKYLYLPVLTQYHPEDGDDPTYPWISNYKLNLQSGRYDDLEATAPVDLYPDNLFDASPLSSRDGGYALWDFIIRNGRTMQRKARDHTEARPISDGTCAFSKPLNTWWLNNVSSSYMQEQMQDLPYHRDFVVGDGFLLDAAHALTHRYGDAKLPALAFWRSYTYLSDVFAQYLADLYVADEFGIPIDIHQPPGQTLAWGVVAHPTLRYGFNHGWPVIQTRYGNDLEPDHDFAHVSVALEIGADPAPVLVPGAPLAVQDRLSYTPRRAICAGWTLSSWLYCQDLKYPEVFGWGERPRAAFTAICPDTFAPHWFDKYLDEAREADIGNTQDHKPFSECKEELMNLIGVSPSLPCTTCLLFNRTITDGIGLAPLRWKSKTTPKDKLKTYQKRLRAALRYVIKAKTQFYGKNYRTIRKERNNSHKELQRKRREDQCKTDPSGFWR